MSAVHIERMLGQCAGAHFEHHCRTFPRRVIVLLNAVNNALPRGKVHHALTANRVRNRPALRRVLTLCLNSNRVMPKHVQIAFGIGLLEKFATLGRWRDRVENTGIRNPCLSVVSDQLIAVSGDAESPGISPRT